MIELTPDTLIGKGLHREVYVHPDDSNKCIKVVVLRGEEETKREQAYYRRLQKQNISWNSLPKFYGNVDTNMGPGAVFDLVRDDDGQVSKTMAYYLDNLAQYQDKQSEFIDALKRLKQDLQNQNIVSMAIKPKNMVIRQTQGKLDCLMVDNIGDSTLIPIALYSNYFAQKKINRKWRRLKRLLAEDWPAAEQIAKEI